MLSFCTCEPCYQSLGVEPFACHNSPKVAAVQTSKPACNNATGMVAVQELKDHVALRLGSRPTAGAPPKTAKAAPAVELRLRLQDVAFVMQHHEMEVGHRLRVCCDPCLCEWIVKHHHFLE